MLSEKENKSPIKATAGTQGNKEHFTSRNLSISNKLIQDLSGKQNIQAITSLNLQFKDDRFPKIQKITGLEELTKLRTLDISYNMITKIEGLHMLRNLVELNLSENSIEIIENLVSNHIY